MRLVAHAYKESKPEKTTQQGHSASDSTTWHGEIIGSIGWLLFSLFDLSGRTWANMSDS